MIKRQLWIVYLVVALVFTMMPFTGQVEMVSAANIASGTSGTCEWVIDKDGNLTVSPIDGDEGQLGNDLNQQWSSYAAQVKTVSFEGKISTKNCAALFRSFTNVMDINLSNLKTEGVKSMVQMFAGCGKLKSLDLSGLDTSNVIYTMDMFTGCSGLTEVDMSMLDLSKLRDADRMFANCTGLTQVDMSGQTMNSIENTTSMFYGCSNLKIINLSNIDISGGEVDTTWMLEGCQNLETLTLGPWDMSRVGEEYSWHGKATFPKTMYDETGKKYKEGTVIPDSKKAVTYYAYIHPYDSGFKIGIDSNAFRNNDYWFWPTILNTMPVKQKYLDDETILKLIQNEGIFNRHRIYWHNLKTDDPDNDKDAYCYGIASTMALLKNGDITSEELAGSGYKNKSYYELGLPVKGYYYEDEDEVRNTTFSEMIRYYYMSQDLLNGGGPNEGCTYTTQIIEGAFDDGLEGALAEIIRITKEKKVGILAWQASNSGHAVVFTGCAEYPDRYEVSVFDENTVSGDYKTHKITDNGRFQTMVIEKDYSSFYIKDEENPKDDKGRFLKELEDAFLIYVIDSSDIIRPDGTLPNGPKITIRGSILLPTSGDYSITLSGGDEIRVENGRITKGTDMIKDISSRVDVSADGDGSASIIIEIPETESISVRMPEDSNTDQSIEMVNDSGFMALEGKNIDSAVLTPGEGIKIEGTDYSFEAATSTKKLISQDDYGLGSVSANTSGTVQITNPQGNKLNVTSENTLRNVEVYSYGPAAKRKEDVAPVSSGLSVDLSTVICEYPDWTWDKTHTVCSRQCIHCGQVETVELIAKDKTYNGKPETSVTVMRNGLVLDRNRYELTFDNKTGIGHKTYTVTYKGEAFQSSFNILPKGTSITKLTKGKKSFTVKWKKQKTKTNGYQIQYSLKKNFKKAKAVTVKNNKVTKKTVKKLKKKKLYYVRVRTFAKVSGKTYYSSWSKARKIKTK